MRTKIAVLAILIFGIFSINALSEKSDGNVDEMSTPTFSSSPYEPTPTPTPSLTSSEVVIGLQVWSYKRVFPLLDGLFQDVASMQLKQLQLDPNQSNGSQVDALAQNFQMQVGYNQMLALQNQGASQMSLANTNLQSSLVQQQGAILQQQIDAQRQLDQATAAYNQLKSSNTTDQTSLSAAQQAMAAAQNTVTSLGTQMQLITSQLKAPVYTPSFPSGNIANPTTAPGNTLPSAAWSTGIGSGSNGPSFPATKQMDNEMDLLWARLSRLVGAMASPDSADPSDRVFLLEFDTGVFPRNRKKQLLDIDYALRCNKSTTQPRVLDMFPRVAAVNITDTKYRDNSFSLGAVLAWMGFGLNTSYNREHLRVSQLLGQSSYITGYGVGQSNFGWKFGIPLGDNQVSSDTKRTFILASFPSGCGTPSISSEHAEWEKSSGKVIASVTPIFQQSPLVAAWEKSDPNAKSDELATVKSIEFNRVEYDPTKVSPSNPALVNVIVRLGQDLDQQDTITVDGTLLKRSRDSFGRAVNGGSSGGLLETAVGGAPGTWMPVASNAFIMTLDASQFGQRFPSIVLASPSSIVSLNSGILPEDAASNRAQTKIGISGRELKCQPDQSCPSLVPSLGFPLAAAKHIGAARWIQDPLKGVSKVFFTIADPTPSQASTSSPATSSVQILSSVSPQQWGTNAEVYAIDDEKGTMTRLTCDPTVSTGTRLTCDLPATDLVRAGFRKSQYQIVDVNHVGGPIQGFSALDNCSTGAGSNYCFGPVLWDIQGPNPDPTTGGWLFTISFVNIDPNNGVTAATFALPTPQSIPATLQGCEGKSGQIPCLITFLLPPTSVNVVNDLMTLSLSMQKGPQTNVQIGNIFRNIEPIVYTIAPDFTSWTGGNLTAAISGIKVGAFGNPHKVSCAANSNCILKEAYSGEGSDYLYVQVSNGAPLPLMQVSSSGTLSPIKYTPPPKPPAVGSGTSQALNIVLQPISPGAIDLTKSKNAVSAQQMVEQRSAPQ